MGKTQGKHREIHLGWNVATLHRHRVAMVICASRRADF